MSPRKSDAPATNPAWPALRRRIAKVPTEPGIYRWRDAEGTVLYVGKAKDLRKRLSSYVPASGKGKAKLIAMGPWKESLMHQVTDFDVTVTNTELEAFLLETMEIKRRRPKYNVLMKDDKNYVYVRVSVQDPYPRVDVVRKVEEDGARYFGPKTSASEVHATLEFLRNLFPFRVCTMEIEPVSCELRAARPVDSSIPEARSSKPVALEVVCRHRDRPTPCLDYHIHQCVAPCTGTITPEEYRRTCIDGVLRFFEGRQDDAFLLLEQRMKEAAAAKQFERAARLRDQLRAMEQVRERQIIADPSGVDADIIGVALRAGRAQVEILQQRSGKIIGQESFTLQGAAQSTADVLDQFLPQYYAAASGVPDLVAIPSSFEGEEILAAWMTETKGRAVKVRVPQRGRVRELLELAGKNAEEHVRQFDAKWEAGERNVTDALAELQSALNLSKPPHRIEGYDISHLGGTETVGSMVVMIDGKSANDRYRTFGLRTLKDGDIDDYRSLREVLTRRLRPVAGGLTRETERLAEKGITLGKATKTEMKRIHEILSLHPDLSASDIDATSMFVARSGEDIVGCVRLRTHDGTLVELAGLWVDEQFRGQRLGHTLSRMLLKTVKKGKVYARVLPALESYYAELGFRHTLKSPPLFVTIWERTKKEHPDTPERTILVYDVAQYRPDRSLQETPDLLVIDGGKGQLAVAVAVLADLGLTIPVVSLAKRDEEVFVPGQSEPLILPPDSPARFLLMRLRDEAHRFANRGREAKGRAKARASALDAIPGIGDQTKQSLLRRFGSVEGVKTATDAQLLEVLSDAQLAVLRRTL
jgi:excinuclease ABC subunit C